MRLATVVLAGGRSRRMGRDKALLSVGGGLRAVDWICAGVPGPVLVASGRRVIRRLPFKQVRDLPGTSGPLAGLAAGLEASPRPWVLLVSCDQPPPSPALIRRLWKARRRSKGVLAVMPSVQDRSLPIPALYHRKALPRVRELLRAGKGPSALAPEARLLPVRFLDPGWNTPAAFRRAIRHLTARDTPPRMPA